MKILTTLICFGLATSSPCHAQDMSRQMATGGCMLFIKQLLHDPDSATFGHSDGASVYLKGNRAVVIREVRATNGFGAMRRAEFLCLLEANGDTITPVFVAPKGENSAQAKAILKRWAFFETPKSSSKK